MLNINILLRFFSPQTTVSNLNSFPECTHAFYSATSLIIAGMSNRWPAVHRGSLAIIFAAAETSHSKM